MTGVQTCALPISTAKATWPGRKQVFRLSDGNGCFRHDVVTVEGDRQDGEALLVPVMREGRRLGKPEPLGESRSRAAAQLARLPARLTGLDAPTEPYRVEISPALRQLADEVDRATAEPANGTSKDQNQFSRR